MIEDELWIVLGIILLLIVAIFSYLVFTHPKFSEFISNAIKNFKMPTPWKKLSK